MMIFNLHTPSCMSSFPKNIGCPPIAATAASVDTLVLVLRLLNIMATHLPARLPSKLLGISPVFIACLWERARRMRVSNSTGLRSAMDSRCRGANGDVRGVDVLECRRHCIADDFFKAFCNGRRPNIGGIAFVIGKPRGLRLRNNNCLDPCGGDIQKKNYGYR